MATKLSDSELASRIRAGNRKRSAIQHVRRRESGKVAVSFWLNAGTKEALKNEATENNESLSVAAERLLSVAMGLKQAADEE